MSQIKRKFLSYRISRGETTESDNNKLFLYVGIAFVAGAILVALLNGGV